MFVFVLTTFALSGLAASQTTDVCPLTLPRDEYLQVHGDFCYQFVIYRQRPYSQADEDCRSHGGTLALVKSQDVTDYIVDQLLYVYGHGSKVWIGLNDKEEEGTFMWEDGTEPDYLNWAPGQGPSSTNLHNSNLQDCVTLVSSKLGQWDDDICEDGLFGFIQHHYSYICQYHQRHMTTTTIAAPVPSCPPFVCDIDCGEEQFMKDPESGCLICQCGSA